MSYSTWKGTVADYKALHVRVAQAFGKPKVCEQCQDDTAKRYEWANVSGEYVFDRNDWKYLCVTCHRRMDADSYTGKRFDGRSHTTESRAKTAESMRKYWEENRDKMNAVHAKASKAKRENNARRRLA